MSVQLQQISDKTKLSLNKLALLKARLLIVEGLDSKSFSRVRRADRLRENLTKQATAKQIASLVSATEFEAEAYKNISVLPTIHKSLKEEIQAILKGLEGDE